MQPENTTVTKKKARSQETTSETSSPEGRAKFGTTIRISWEIYDHIISQGKFSESFNDVLARLLKLS